jgi:hypothetical protein
MKPHHVIFLVMVDALYGAAIVVLALECIK